MNRYLHVWFAVFASSITSLPAQPNVDSIMVSLGYPSSDTAAILTLYDVGYELELAEPYSALDIYREGINWSSQINYFNGVGKGYNYCGIIWFNLGLIDSAITCARRSLPWFEKSGNKLGYAASLNNVGNGYNVNNSYTEAIQSYQEANAIYESLGEEVNIISNLNNIGNMLVRSGNTNLAEQYLVDALRRAEKTGFLSGLGDVNNNLGSYHQALDQHDLALPYFTTALRYYEEIGQPSFIVQSHSNIGQCCLTLEDLSCAVTHLEQALYILDTLNLPREKVNVMSNLGMIYNTQQEYSKALKFSSEAFPLAEELGDLVFETRLLEVMAASYEGLGDHVSATATIRKLLDLTRQKFDVDRNRQLLDLERKYESEQKERRILEQELQLHQKSSQNRLVLILSTLAIIIAILILLWLRGRMQVNKRLAQQQATLQAQRIREMEQDQKLAVLNAVIDGQEKERNRIARDLHDGLGGTLAATKLHITSMINQIQFPLPHMMKQKTADLFDHTAQEIRRIAHNMTPAALTDEGLLPAIEEIASGLRESEGMVVVVQTIGEVGRLEETREIMIYRIIQELIQNILKHASASKVIIQIHRQQGELNLLVEDDGRGFKSSLSTRGLGLKSIESRVQYLNGTVDIDSVQGEGTTVLVNVPLPEETGDNKQKLDEVYGA